MAGDLRFVCGEGYNLLGRSGVLITPGAFDPLYPVGNLFDGLPSRCYKAGSNAADITISFDLNNILNPGFETSSLASWTDASTDGGSSVETMGGGEVYIGARAMKLLGGAGGIGKRYQDIQVRSGEPRNLEVAIAGDGTASARIQLLNLSNGKYLQPGGASWGAVTDLFSRSIASHAVQSVSYTVEDWETLQASVVTLRIIAYVNQNGSGCFDAFADFPTWNFLGVFGHNHAPVVVPQLLSSNDGFSASTTIEASLTPYAHQYYTYLTSAVSKRWMAFKLRGTNTATPFVGELVLSHLRTGLRAQNPEFSYQHSFPQIRSQGGEYVFLQSSSPRTGVTLPMKRVQDAHIRESVQEIFYRCSGGANTIVVIPEEGQREVVLGRILSDFERQRRNLFQDDTVVVEPLPYASVVS